jgi:hypothetical protein
MRHVSGIVLVLCLHMGSVGSAQDSGVNDLIGTWDDVTPEQRERVGYRLALPQVSLTFVGSACVWEVPGGRPVRQSLFIPVQAGPHRGMDFVTVSSGAFLTTRALYKVEGDTLTIKEGALDRPRPTDLARWEFDGQNSDGMASFHVYKRRVK